MKPWQTSPLLKVEHLTMRFGGLLAVDDVSFSVGRTDITALIGPNGAGKTTVFNCITGFYKPTEGLMLLTHPGGESFNLERLDDHNINSCARVARTFQNIRLFQGMTVLENLMVADEPAGSLPYGDQRRLEIARAMCTRPLLLCLDEPAAGLNARESDGLNELLFSIRAEEGISLLLIEHDMSVVMRISDHVVVLDYGKKIADGTTDEARNDPRVIAAYLGVPDEELPVIEREVGL
jgi:branched-chain amino acid transport system ATP-binding protein